MSPTHEHRETTTRFKQTKKSNGDSGQKAGERVYEWKGGDATEKKGGETDGEPYLIPAKPGGLHAVGEESDTREGGLKMVGPSKLLAHQLCEVTETRRFSAFLCGKKSLAKVPADKAI
ncbi:hypothetical protein NL676_011381 [Syzygium grande]|nr:hypothetical protein NL676_011381 [Syzygium grande]